MTKVWIYRNLVKALPWFTDVREKINNPQYSGWFLPYKPEGPYYQHQQGNTDLYLDYGQTPTGDCGGITCGEYLFDHRNESLREYLLDVYIGGPDAMGNENVSGLFIDDFWSNYPFILPWSSNDCSTGENGGASEMYTHCVDDMGLSADDIEEIAQNWLKTTNMAFEKIVDMGGYAWQMLQSPDGDSLSPSSPRPASLFREWCQPEKLSQPIFMQFTNSTDLPLCCAEQVRFEYIGCFFQQKKFFLIFIKATEIKRHRLNLALIPFFCSCV